MASAALFGDSSRTFSQWRKNLPFEQATSFLLPALMTQEIRKRKARKPIRRFSELGRSQRLRIIHMLKKTQGLAIGELAGRLDLSYMGVKQHCEELERQGFLDTRRRPKPIGRPEIVYRLTPKPRIPLRSRSYRLPVSSTVQMRPRNFWSPCSGRRPKDTPSSLRKVI